MITRNLLLFAALGVAALAQKANDPGTLEVGFEQRVRNENWNNLFDYSNRLDDEREQIRYRTRAWMKLPLGTTVDFFAGVNQETNQKLGKDNVFDEIIFDNLYLDFKKLFVKGLSLRVGRQNFIKGEGFLFLEGNPGDGSRSIYSNAVNLAYERKKSKLELLAILNPAYDRMLPRIHDQHKLLQDWDQKSLGAYYTDRNHKNVSVESYYFYTKEVHDRLARTSFQFQGDRHLSTLGGRVVRQITPHWSATGEFAEEWGFQRPASTVAAWGGYGYVKRTFDTRWKPYITGGYWVFSGDDPNTKNRIEGFDPIYARWPKWSELYIYSQFREVGVGYWTNTKMWEAEAGVTPSKHWAGRLTWYKMDAYHPFPAGDQRIFGTGLGRGNMVQGRVDYAMNNTWKAHVLYEGLFPGNFYRSGNYSYFLRFEMSYQITASLVPSWMKH